MRIVPDSAGVGVREFNPCHYPAGPHGGQFAPKGYGQCSDGASTPPTVRPEFAAHVRANRPASAAEATNAERYRDLFGRARIVTRMTTRGLDGLLRDRRFRTIHSGGTSTTRVSAQERAAAEVTLFGPEAAPPVYGYMQEDLTKLGDDDYRVDAYGPVAVLFKEHVRDRTTAILGDSFLQVGPPGLDHDRRPVRKMPEPLSAITHLIGGLRADVLASLASLDDYDGNFQSRMQYGDDASPEYPEAQIHTRAGDPPLGLHDIEAVYLPTSAATPARVTRLRRHGIRVVVGGTRKVYPAWDR